MNQKSIIKHITHNEESIGEECIVEDAKLRQPTMRKNHYQIACSEKFITCMKSLNLEHCHLARVVKPATQKKSLCVINISIM